MLVIHDEKMKERNFFSKKKKGRKEEEEGKNCQWRIIAPL